MMRHKKKDMETAIQNSSNYNFSPKISGAGDNRAILKSQVEFMSLL